MHIPNSGDGRATNLGVWRELLISGINNTQNSTNKAEYLYYATAEPFSVLQIKN